MCVRLWILQISNSSSKNLIVDVTRHWFPIGYFQFNQNLWNNRIMCKYLCMWRMLAEVFWNKYILDFTFFLGMTEIFLKPNQRTRPENTAREFMVNILANHLQFSDNFPFCSRNCVAIFLAGSPKGWEETWKRCFWQNIFLKENIFIINIIIMRTWKRDKELIFIWRFQNKAFLNKTFWIIWFFSTIRSPKWEVIHSRLLQKKQKEEQKQKQNKEDKTKQRQKQEKQTK